MFGHRLARSAAFVAWALAAACAVYWGLRVGVGRPGLPPDAQPVSASGGLHGDISRLLGASQVAQADVPAPPGLASRFKLIGVMAPKTKATTPADPAPGIALISLDGKPPRAYRVGSRIDGELLLRSVAQRSAQVGAADGSVALTLELAPLPAPATGSLPSAAAGLVSAAAGREPPPIQPAPPGLAMAGVPPGQMAPVPPPPTSETGVPPEQGGPANPGGDPSLRR
ncbi:hypothetical protein [Rivibacter subsaxonicus]|uniref:General secretion pathway protein C n=1 Tax=Rivibacter subsaxonicus TaxID=457575 RepID=A0A4Q7VZ14_9BURK|nr:hypothetical protein [Rivibacter subsaxonicus]RZU02054.1 general secretion pathway protein C [Rivibacter subsaxonicus]